MLYQLPNGKVIHISIEEYLDLTDEDIQYLMSLDYGEHITDPFSGSALRKNSKSRRSDFNQEDIDENLSDNLFDI